MAKNENVQKPDIFTKLVYGQIRELSDLEKTMVELTGKIYCVESKYWLENAKEGSNFNENEVICEAVSSAFAIVAGVLESTRG